MLGALSFDRETLRLERGGGFGGQKELEEFACFGLGGGGEGHGVQDLGVAILGERPTLTAGSDLASVP